MQRYLMVLVVATLMGDVQGYYTKEKKSKWCFPQVGCMVTLSKKYMTNDVDKAHKTCREIDKEGRLVGQADSQKLLHQWQIIQQVEQEEAHAVLLDAKLTKKPNATLANFTWGYDNSTVKGYRNIKAPECGNGVLVYHFGKITPKMCVKAPNMKFLVICAFPCKKIKNLTEVESKAECNEICVNHPPCSDSIFLKPSVCVLQPEGLENDCSVFFGESLLKEEYMDHKVVTKRDHASSASGHEDFLKLVVTTITFVFAAVGFVVCICFCVQYIKTGALAEEYMASLKISAIKQPTFQRDPTNSVLSKTKKVNEGILDKNLSKTPNKRRKDLENFSSSSLSDKSDKFVDKKEGLNRKPGVDSFAVKSDASISLEENAKPLAITSGKLIQKPNLNSIKKNAPTNKNTQITSDSNKAPIKDKTSKNAQIISDPKKTLMKEKTQVKPETPLDTSVQSSNTRKKADKNVANLPVPMNNDISKTPTKEATEVLEEPEIPLISLSQNPTNNKDAATAEKLPVKADNDAKKTAKSKKKALDEPKKEAFVETPAEDVKFKPIKKEIDLKAQIEKAQDNQRKEIDLWKKRDKNKHEKKLLSQKTEKDKRKSDRKKGKRPQTPKRPLKNHSLVAEGKSLSSIELDSDNKIKTTNLKELAAKVQKFREENFGKR